MKGQSQYALLDPVFLTDGVFIPQSRVPKAINIKRKWGNDTVQFMGTQLDTRHQSVLLAICAQAARYGQAFNGTDADPSIVKQLIFSLNATNDVINESNQIIKMNRSDLLIDAGLTNSGQNYKLLIELLKQLSTFTIYYETEIIQNNEEIKKGGSSHLLSFQYINTKLTICLNWRLSQALLGGQKIKISLQERKRLKKDSSKILLAWLTSYVRKGNTLMAGNGAKLDTLIKHIWGETMMTRQSKHRKRTLTIKALTEIGQLTNWQTNISSNFHVTVSHFKLTT